VLGEGLAGDQPRGELRQPGGHRHLGRQRVELLYDRRVERHDDGRFDSLELAQLGGEHPRHLEGLDVLAPLDLDVEGQVGEAGGDLAERRDGEVVGVVAGGRRLLPGSDPPVRILPGGPVPARPAPRPPMGGVERL
jgi:hypothetical protein